MACKDKEVRSGGREDEKKKRKKTLHLFPHKVLSIQSDTDKKRTLELWVLNLEQSVSSTQKIQARYMILPLGESDERNVFCYCSVKRNPQAGEAVVSSEIQGWNMNE